MKLTILSPGPLTTIQDGGRFGAMGKGFSPGGAMDQEAMVLANLLVGNAPGVGVLEMTMLGITARFDCDCAIALTGANMSAQLNGSPIARYCSVRVHAGDVLSMKTAKHGMRAYLAVAGGFDLPVVMGSVSTNVKCVLGGFQGRKLQAGDELPLNQSGAAFQSRQIPPPEDYPGSISLRVLLGPQDDAFTRKGIDTFLGSEYTVTDKADRMGIRLSGEKIESKDGVDILSDGIAAGSVQIPASGTPIIMMADRQTTGGYAKIATVISADLGRAAQARPGTRIHFVQVTETEAIRLRREAEKKRKQLEYELLYG
ncbi:MAG: biotin-dependent carboxyltransferase family protein [Eubacteriales bacterium]|nr:biotin-dependent carboxyltransferase family protein [Eubacteriales bacterium]